MAKLSKTQFGRAIEGNPVETTKVYVVPSSPRESKRAGTIVITALITTIGIGAGWIGGKVLSGRIGRGPEAAVPIDTSIPQTSLPNTQPSQSQAPAKRNSAVENPSASGSEPASEPEQRVAPEAPPKPSASREAPPKVPRVDKNEESDTATEEDPSKEIGRKALKKMSKETQKMKRALGNKNENDPNY